MENPGNNSFFSDKTEDYPVRVDNKTGSTEQDFFHCHLKNNQWIQYKEM